MTKVIRKVTAGGRVEHGLRDPPGDKRHDTQSRRRWVLHLLGDSGADLNSTYLCTGRPARSTAWGLPRTRRVKHQT